MTPAVGLLALATAVSSNTGYAASLEDLAGVSFQRFGDRGSGRLVHVGAFPYLTGVRFGLHHVGEGGFVLGGLVGASTASISRTDDDRRTTYVTAAPRVGWAFRTEETVGGWIRFGPTYRLVATDRTQQWLDLSLEAHLIVRFLPGVALLFGPSAEFSVGKKEQRHVSLALLAGLRVIL